MGIMIHLGYKTSSGGGPPSPVDGPQHTVWPFDAWCKLLPDLARVGVTVPVTPPVVKGATLGSNYDPFDAFDLGSKVQGGRRETRYGSVEQAMRFVAVAQALGMEVYVNIVHHHVDGDKGDQVYQYVGADGKTKNGRFPKDHNCFCQVWPNPDHVADPSWDLAFGREFMWNLGTYGDGEGDNGPGYVRKGLADSLAWQTQRLDVSGYFLDDVKGTSPVYVGFLLREPVMSGKVAFGEYSDGNTATLMNWMHNTAVNGACGVLDFALRYKIRDALAGGDIRAIQQQGVCWTDPTHSVTFIEDADLDLSDPIISNKLLGYAMILTMPGYPMLFGKDLYEYGLLTPVMNLCWIHETFAKGDTWWRATSSRYLVYERMGDNTGSGCLVGVTTRSGKLGHPADWTPVTVMTKWPNTRLHDYTGHSEDQWTDQHGQVTIYLPPNDGGRGYVVFAPEGQTNVIHLTPKRTKQAFFGADDLDIGPAINGSFPVGQVWAREGTQFSCKLTVDQQWIAPGGKVTYAVTGPTGAALKFDANGYADTHTSGWHTVSVVGTGLDASVPFDLEVTYMGAPL